MIYKKSRLEDYFANSRLAINNVKNNTEVRELLNPFNVDDARFETGIALLDSAFEKETILIEKRGLQLTAKSDMKRLLNETHPIYMKHVRFTKLAVRGNTEKLVGLGLIVPRKKNINGWLKQTQIFYANVVKDDEVMQYLARNGITLEELNATKQKVLEVALANEKHKEAIALVQDAVVERDDALEEFDFWMDEFIVICKEGLKDRPQLLEMLGINVLSKGYRRRKSTTNNESENQTPAEQPQTEATQTQEEQTQ
ncbi:MAG: hypothetical protein JSV88_14970 [Candidatus Aminicenantes bacterium]|nr:MAG: hypothetical protein JSV88_14970 [Candidatus Aminicenantes bacterium]